MEFALVVPIFLLLLFTVLEYGWVLTQQIVLTNAVSTGARAALKARNWGAHNEDPEAFARDAFKIAYWFTDVDDDQIETNLRKNPHRIEVAVRSLNCQPLTGYLPRCLLPRTLSARAVMVFP
ncbi:MAG: pilus assembly protein [Desulfosarcina sp.]|nr:pilus assembly protein [Desulfobacterales bacterium]